MIRPLQLPALRDWLVVALATGQLAVFQLAAETVAPVPAPQKLFSAPTNLSPSLLPPLPHLKSPVNLFRELLAMTPAGRENYLTNRPPGIRARILAKVREYEALDPNERELRLRATELRWYLLPLLHESPTNRTARLATIPDDLQPLVKNRLRQWDILPPTLQAEFLESERTLRYFTHVDPAHSPSLPPLPQDQRRRHNPRGPDLAHWDKLSEDQRQKITAQCSRFFELTPMEKKKTLNTLSDAERQQMEKTLETFGKLPPAQRLKCIRAFTEFAGLSVQEKQDFLKNAQRWAQMSPKDRQTWRDLVTHVPEWPPLPSALIMPPMPPAFHAPLATNHG
jgi:hypothetical protein